MKTLRFSWFNGPQDGASAVRADHNRWRWPEQEAPVGRNAGTLDSRATSH